MYYRLYDNSITTYIYSVYTLYKSIDIALTAPLVRCLCGEFDTLVAKCVFIVDLNPFRSVVPVQ